MKAQHILAIDAKQFSDAKAQTAQLIPEKNLISDPGQIFIMQRERAETDENFRHVIPYTVVRNTEGDILIYARGSGVGEQRLAGKQSVGFGGHVDLHDVRYDASVIDLEETLKDAAERELKEELGISASEISRISIVGVILDNSNAVGRVHVGQLLIVDYSGDWKSVRSKEEELKIVEWLKPEDISDLFMENWSKAAIGYLAKERRRILMTPEESAEAWVSEVLVEIEKEKAEVEAAKPHWFKRMLGIAA